MDIKPPLAGVLYHSFYDKANECPQNLNKHGVKASFQEAGDTMPGSVRICMSDFEKQLQPLPVHDLDAPCLLKDEHATYVSSLRSLVNAIKDVAVKHGKEAETVLVR